ncbi:MAG TPA: Ig-like domain-containing protein [Solirubrobacteraceae bacterium]|nr:Ig-like domain-containing protein [Solirubrobacteraceae bacterium]
MPGGNPSSLARGAAIAAGLLIAAAIGASAAAATTMPGGPLSVSVGLLGQCQSSYPTVGNNFYPATGAVGDCGFFMGFPDAGNPAFLQGKVFGFKGIEGPGLAWQYTAVGQRAVTGTGTASDPYELVTTFTVSDPGKAEKNDYALIEETTQYVNGEPQFTSTFDVENVTGESIPGLSTAPAAPLRFHAIFAGDLRAGDSDFGTGVLSAGPPRTLGAANEATGAFSGFVEAPAPSPAWSNYQTGCWDVVPELEGRCPTTSPADGGIWAAVRSAGDEAPVFNGDVDPNLVDNAAGVSWDDHLNKALKPGEHARYTIVNRARIPTSLVVQPATQTQTVERTATVLVTATDNTGVPYANRRLVYSIGPTNPKSGSVLTSPSGVATISYVGTAAGADTVQMYLDLGGSGAQTRSDPASAAQITWIGAAPTPSSRFRLRSVRANARGVVTIALVPLQDGKATAEVSAPTAAIARSLATGAKRAACKRGQVVIKRRCRPRTTLTGRASAGGHAGRTLTLTVKPSRKLSSALAKGRVLRLTTKLIYRSRLGGAAATRTLQLTVKGRHKRHQ